MPHSSGKPLRTALAGCGRIGERHARILAAAPETELVGLADADRSRAEGFAARHGGRAYSSASEMLAAEAPDLAVFCTPSGVHARGVLEASRTGVREIVVEKPMA